jgi:hypothetical protein
MYNVVCRSRTIKARYAASASGSSRIEMQAMYSAVNLEKFALTETAGYSACRLHDEDIVLDKVKNSTPPCTRKMYKAD